jgi:hypothetical protein
LSLTCTLCNEPVDPTSTTTLQRVVAWERRAIGDTRKSGRDIVLREHRDEFAHSRCVEKVRSGVPIAQESML